MRKVVIIAMVCILVVLGVFVVRAYMQVQEEKHIESLQNSISELLNNEEFAEVFSIYNAEESKYTQYMDVQIEHYAQSLCAVASDELNTEKLLAFKEAGGTSVLVDNTINDINDMLDMLGVSEENYTNALNAYSIRDYDKAKEHFQAIIPEHEKYSEAQNYITEITAIQTSWDSTHYGRSPYLNGFAYDGEYLYVPFRINDVDGIYKTSQDGTDTQFIPINKDDMKLDIYGINVVGEYLYFIAGEKIGTGYLFDAPYNIYKMNKDGTDITLEVEGNFTELFIEGDGAFVISREDGLIKFDKYLTNSTIISNQDVIEFSWSDEGLYYTVRENLEYNSYNSVYLYDGQSSAMLYTEEHLHYYDFGDRYLKWRTASDSAEALYFGDKEEEKMLTRNDLNTVYGIIQDTILYSTYGKWQQEYAHVYDLEASKMLVKNSYADLLEYKTLGIFYEEDKLVIEMDRKLYFSDVSGKDITEIALADISDEMLDINMEQIKHIGDSELYLDEGEAPNISVISDKQHWHYNDAHINLYIEKRYMEAYDSNVYVTHIFINDYSLFKTANGSEYDNAIETFRATEISDKYQMIYGQNGDTFLDSRNKYMGIIIRNGKVLRKALRYDMLAFFEDGTMEIYTSADDITGEELVNAGAMMSFSFGPVLMKDYEVFSESASDNLSARNPRSAIGYVEPGHYVSIVCDGRDEKVSRGLSMIQLATVFEEEGCKLAYNLDGGSTSTIIFFGNYITRRTAHPGVPEIYNHRPVAELFYIGTSEISPLDLMEYTYDYAYYVENIK